MSKLARLLGIFLLSSAASAATNTIAFVNGPVGGPGYIYHLNAGEVGSTKINAAFCGNTSTICWPEFAPDGYRLAFQAAINGSAIYLVNLDGTGLTRLSVPTGAADASPSFSPDGSKLVYNQVTNPNSNPATITVAVMNTDGTNPVQLITPVTGVFNIEPHWSVNNEIVYVSNASGGGHQDVWVMNSDGSNQHALTSSGLWGDPEWSPDGVTIGVSHSPDGVQLNVYSMLRDGSNITQITHFTAPQEGAVPSFNCDGSLIAFEWDIGGNVERIFTAPTEVWIVNANGFNPHTTGQACANEGCHPKWSWQ